MSRLQEFVAEELWLLIAIVTFVAGMFLAIAGFETLLVVTIGLGWFLLVPIFLFWGDEIADGLFDTDSADDAAETDNDEAAITELKRRYAEGEIDDDEFERRLDRLLAVDDVLEDVFADRHEASASERASRTDASHAQRSGTTGRDTEDATAHERERETE